jgi:hypothetical protein
MPEIGFLFFIWHDHYTCLFFVHYLQQNFQYRVLCESSQSDRPWSELLQDTSYLIIGRLKTLQEAFITVEVLSVCDDQQPYISETNTVEPL